MLTLNNITKVYQSGDIKQTALDGVSLSFRESEFVSILGQSGSGKTTLLNIIGGLDQYTSGDLVIDGVSTKEYKDRDWDTYRNHRIGFVFQSYNLIPHISVLENVEMALTLSGIGKRSRKSRAVQALKEVGLEPYINKRPNELSGGQMQRVAIARAIVNDPDIILADEPTGALDTETATQVMDIIKELSKDRLVIMVTHNPEIAEQYSTRIVKLKDGKITSDSNPYYEKEDIKQHVPKEKKSKMSLKTALSLSFKNLLTKKGRTSLTAIAGSIGIIGIALILALSNGIQLYINKVQEDTLSTYPLTIEKQTVDYSVIFNLDRDEGKDHPLDAVYTNSNLQKLANAFMSGITTNDLKSLKTFFESKPDMKNLLSDVQYSYGAKFSIYVVHDGEYNEADTAVVFDAVYEELFGTKYSDMMSTFGGFNIGGSSMNVSSQMIDNQDLLASQYDVIAGKWPETANEVVLVVNENNEISDLMLYALGLKDRSVLSERAKLLKEGKELPYDDSTFTYEEILGLTLKALTPGKRYVEEEQAGKKIYTERSPEELPDDAFIELKVVGILRPSPNAVAQSITTPFAYTKALTELCIQQNESSPAMKTQLDNPDTDIFTGKSFENNADDITIETVQQYLAMMPEEEQQKYQGMIAMMDPQVVVDMFKKMIGTTNTYEGNLNTLGRVDTTDPQSITIYAKDFASKQVIEDYIAEFNSTRADENKIVYTDYVGLLMSSVTTIIDIISYVLIAFVSISLVVSSIMIGIITYISVLERTREIGILRAMGASKKDISRVFMAETGIIGFISGCFGILMTLIICIPGNMVIHNLTNNQSINAVLPPEGLILIAVSVALTLIAGIIPARMAAKKNPVVALRTE